MAGVLDAFRFVVVIGVLIFVHELGHFIMAKRAGILVQRFSFGFGPRLFGVKRGETDYCVSGIPFGGYVKMAGQEDLPGTDDSEGVPEERKFSSKSVARRMGVIVAGPLMNLVLGFFLFIAVMVMGQEVDEWYFDTKIGAVEKGSPAEEAKLRPNDRILSINGRKAENWQDMLLASLSNAKREMAVEVDRDGRIMEFTVRSSDFDNSGRPRMGVLPFVPAIIGTPTEGMPAHAAGLQKGDRIVAVNGVEVGVDETLRITGENVEQPLEYEVERNGTRFKRTIKPVAVGEIEHALIVKGRIEMISPSFAKETGLAGGDEIQFINNVAVKPEEVEEVIMMNPSSKLTLGIHRPAGTLFGIFSRREAKDFSVEITTQERAMIGVPLYPSPDVPMPKVLVRYGILAAIPRGIAEGWSTFVTSVRSVWLIVSRRVSTKALGGPVFIYRLTQEAAREGIDWLLKLVGLISIALSIFNLLPIPVLDGGHVAFLAVEAVRKKPIDAKYQEVLQYVGVILFVMFFLFVTYNDILRWLGERVLP